VSPLTAKKPLIDEAADQNDLHRHQGLSCCFTVPRCRCRPGPLTFVAGAIRRHRAAIGSPWRKLNPARQALLVLAYLRKGDTFAELAAGFAVGTTTAWRYVNLRREALVRREALGVEGGGRPSRRAVAAAWQKLSAA
jgi:Helix-turn-helix of DDE superfamily endonuclease